MTIIKKIINWIINLFRKLFGVKKKKTRVNSPMFSSSKKDNKQKEINVSFNDTMPSYMVINDTSKEKLLYSIALMKNIIEENHNNIIEQAEKELLESIKSNEKANLTNSSLEERLSYSKLDYIIKDFDKEEKKEIIDKYQIIKKREEEFKVHLEDIDRVVDLIKNNDISIVTENEIDREVNNILNDKNLTNDLEDKTDNFTKKVRDIYDNVDDKLLSDVVKEYKKVNYVTLTTTIIDKNYEQFKKLEEDFKNHRYNKYYYEREINRIKREINKVKNLKNNKEVNDHIMSLQKELYTKSKDKYDLLYNNEVFTNVLKECDNLLEKINAKVVDINKEKEIIEESEEKKRKQKYVENILLRFQDMEHARALIRKALEEDPSLMYPGDLEKTIEAIYERFNNGIEDDFNFLKNKERTEYVILYNDLNRIISTQKKEEYYTIDHINFKLEDLAEAVEVKMDEVNGIMKKKNIYYDDTVTREKIELSNPKKINNSMVLKKNSDNKKR